MVTPIFTVWIWNKIQSLFTCTPPNFLRHGVVLATTIFFLSGCGHQRTTYYPDPSSGEPMRKEIAEAKRSEEIAKLPTEFDEPIRLLYGGLPTYPYYLRQAGIEGAVRVGFIVNEIGGVEKATILSSPDKRLSDLSLESIRSWRFAPLKKKGTPTKAYFVQEFPFKLVP
jgi:TonB family protein